jgi:cysteinyl-tRNA synthetase
VINQLHAKKSGPFTVNPETFEKFKKDFHTLFSDILGLQMEADAGNAGQQNETMDGLMALIGELRATARQEKNWGVSDKIRDKLNELNIEVKDTPEGMEWKIG